MRGAAAAAAAGGAEGGACSLGSSGRGSRLCAASQAFVGPGRGDGRRHWTTWVAPKYLTHNFAAAAQRRERIVPT